jgi:hypothetical protein
MAGPLSCFEPTISNLRWVFRLFETYGCGLNHKVKSINQSADTRERKELSQYLPKDLFRYPAMKIYEQITNLTSNYLPVVDGSKWLTREVNTWFSTPAKQSFQTVCLPTLKVRF